MIRMCLPKAVNGMNTFTGNANSQNIQYRHFFNRVLSTKKHKLYKERRLLGYSAEQMYDIVIDVDKYSQFVPWCTESSVLHELESGGRLCKLGVGFPPLSESYTSIVTFYRPKMVKSVSGDSGMFSHLVNEWTFHDGLPGNPKTCSIEFKVDFEFRSALHSQLSQLFFDQVVKMMVNAFLNRAKELYGKESIPRQKPQIVAYMNK